MSEHEKVSRLITYDCGHTQHYKNPYPKVGEMLYCLKCRMEVRVKLAPAEWRIRCRHCVYSRPFGDARLNAEISAAKHRRNHPSHVVALFQGGELIRTFPANPTDTGADCNQTVMF
jgi:hypothetical protein